MSTPTIAPARRGVVYVAIAAASWGTTGAVAAILYRDGGLGPVAVSWWRFAIGAVFLALGRRLIGNRADPRPVRRRYQRLVVIGVGLAVYHTAYFAAVALAGVAVATVVTLGAAPLLIAAGSRIFIAERAGPGEPAMLAIAVAGLGLLALDTGQPATVAPAPLAGIGLALLSAAGYAAVTLIQRGAGGGADPYRSALVGFGVATACLLPFAAIEGLLPTGNPLWSVMLLVYLGVVPTAVAYGLYFAALRRVRATTASMVALLEPMTATAIAVALLGERLTAIAATGSAALLIAVGLQVGRTHRAATG